MNIITTWVETQPQADPTYQYLGNFILLPEVYTRSPFLRTDVSPSLNFGALGSIIGRYIIRGFSGYGSLYNSKGEVDDWWSPSTRRNYRQETRCFSSQIQWFTNPFTGEEINGSIHEDTLVSDNAALKSAYKAYRVYMTKYEELYKTIIIEGLDWYTQDQIFFISYAMNFPLYVVLRVPGHTGSAGKELAHQLACETLIQAPVVPWPFPLMADEAHFYKTTLKQHYAQLRTSVQTLPTPHPQL
ncbi:neprilysin-11-like [Ixodes scapularis]|uniref:neprilysin-11-like n=1 Tax=Ixodes scapularis TaxID=6945 RepID=UPI001A9EDDD2|nr:neprilysin-11-like [Ixodes scapularis]